MKLLYHASLSDGATSSQRLEAFRRIDGVTTIAHDTLERMGDSTAFHRRVLWRLGWPVDHYRENERLTEAASRERPDIVFVDNSKVLRASTLRRLRELGARKLVYYTPDDAMNPLNLKRPLLTSFPEWDVFFTTKSFNVPELKSRGARNPVLVGKAYDPDLHRPLDRAEVGEDFERFDLVFIGACERERLVSLNALCEAGLNVVVYGGDLGKWDRRELHPSLTSRPAVFGEGYARALHHGKIALCFLRKMNRDRITQRSMEITAMGRPMLAEKTDEHDAHFVDGEEYAGFRSDEELVARARRLLADDAARANMGARARGRCLISGYSTIDRAREMIAAMTQTT